MSPTENTSFDIREQAPVKPPGHWDSPLLDYLPPDISADSMTDVQESVLKHNFDPMLKDLELTYMSRFQSGSWGFSEPSSETSGKSVLDTAATSSIKSRWSLGLLSAQKLRLSYQREFAGRDLKITCEAQSGEQGLSFHLFRPLSMQWNLGISHETQSRRSQIQMNYTW